jgi:hypothetical protein
MRRNSGDEEIRKLLRKAGQGDWRAAEQAAAILKRRAGHEVGRTAWESLSEFCDDIDATGGIVISERGEYEPVADQDWVDLGSTYVTACHVLGREPMIAETIDEQTGDAIRYAYRYSNESGVPLVTCPECGGDLTADGGIMLVVSGYRPLELRSRLDSSGNLIDVDDQVATGHHGGTYCGRCGELLINIDYVVETQTTD